VIASVAPSSGKSDGGESVTVHGANFSAATHVSFGADADTGAGGIAAAVTFIDSGTLEVLTPGHAAGTINVMASDADTGQAVVALAAFAYAAPSGGGGGCSIAPLASPPDPRDAVSSSGWIALVLAWQWNRSRKKRAASGV